MKRKAPIKICIDNTSFLPIVGGTETYCHQLLSSISANTTNIKLLCEIPLDGIDKINNHSIFRFGRISQNSGYTDSEDIDRGYGLGRTLMNRTEAFNCLEKISGVGFGGFYEELFKNQPQIILVNDLMRVPFAPYLQIAPFINNSKLIVNLHGILTSFSQFWEEFPEKRKFVADFIKSYPKDIYYITPSKHVYDEALSWGIKKECLRLIYLGVDTHLFQPAAYKEKLAAKRVLLSKLNLPPLEEKELLIGFPSRAVDHKGIDVALSALRKVAQLDESRKFKLLIAGGSSDNPESLIDIRQMIEYSGIANRVLLGTDMFVEYPNSMVTFYHACDLCLFPSRRDALGYGAIESMACGIPVIGTSIPGLCEAMGIEMNHHGDCPGGWAIINEDSSNLAAQIEVILNNPSILHFKGRVAREWVEKNFTLKRMIEEHLELFAQVVSTN